MPRIMNLLTAVLWITTGLPLFIGMGGLYALDLGDYFGGTIAILVCLVMFASIGWILRVIYVNWFNTRNRYEDRLDFAESILLAFTCLGVIVSIPAFLAGIFSPPNNQYSTLIQIVSVPFLLVSLYLAWGYFVPRTKKLR